MKTATFFIAKKAAEAVQTMSDGADKKTVYGTVICLLLDSLDSKSRQSVVSDVLTASAPTKEQKLLDRNQVLATLGIKYTSLYNLMCRGEFPQPLKIGRRSLWKETDVDHYIEMADRKRVSTGVQ